MRMVEEFRAALWDSRISSSGLKKGSLWCRYHEWLILLVESQKVYQLFNYLLFCTSFITYLLRTIHLSIVKRAQCPVIIFMCNKVWIWLSSSLQAAVENLVVLPTTPNTSTDGDTTHDYAEIYTPSRGKRTGLLLFASWVALRGVGMLLFPLLTLRLSVSWKLFGITTVQLTNPLEK